MYRGHSVGRYQYLCCRGCGLASLDPKPDSVELSTFYNTRFQVDRARQTRKLIRTSIELLNRLDSCLLGRGRLLEAGCSYGYFLNAARERGWGVEGVEISSSACAFARSEFGLTVHEGTLATVSSMLHPPYDAIAMLHVIEHETDPPAVIKQIAALLKEDGTLILKTPNVASWISRVCGSSWEWLSPPAHLCLFSPTSIRLMLERQGFQILHLATQRGDAHNPLFEVIRSSAKRISGRKETEFQSSASVPPSATRWYRTLEALTDAISKPFTPLENHLFGRGLLHPELLVVARNTGGPGPAAGAF